MRSYSDSASGSSEVMTAFVPVFAMGDFSFSLNLDPHQIEAPMKPEGKTLPFWLSYGFSFLESVNWTSPSGRSAVAFDKKSYLKGDPTGLFPGFNHYWDGVHERLSFDSSVECSFYSHRLFFSDLSFSDWADDRASFVSGLLFDFSFDHVAFGTGLLSDIGYGERSVTSLFPELWFSFPIVKEPVSFGIDIGAVMAVDDIHDWQYEDADNYGVYLALPLSFRNYDMKLGTMWQSGTVYYGRYSDRYEPIPTEEPTLAFYWTSLYSDMNVDVKLDFLLNMDPFTGKLIADNTFSDFSVGFSMGAIDMIVGVRKQNVFNYSDWIGTSDIYFGMETSTGSLRNRLIFRFNGGEPLLGFSSSLELVDIDSVGMEEHRESLVSLRFDLGFRSIHNEDPEFLLNPILTVGVEDYRLSLRIPLDLSVGKKELSITPPKGDSWWDLWQDTSTLDAVYDSVTDMFVFIEGLELGPKDGIFHVELSRTDRRNDIFFENYRGQNALSMSASLNFANLSVGLWVDDMEAPRIIDPKLTWWPWDNESAALIVSAPTEILMKDFRNYEVTSFFGLTFSYPFLKNRLSLSAFAYGEISALYEDGIPVETGIIYDFTDDRFGSYLLGGELGWRDEHWHASFAGGMNRGLLYPNYWNAFTSQDPDRNREEQDEDIDFTIWMIAEAGITFDSVEFLVKYMLPDMAAFWEPEREQDGDMLTLALRFTLPNGVGMGMKVSRLDLISTFSEISDIKEYIMSEETIYAFSLIKEMGKMSLEAELSAQAYYGESRNGWMNSYSLLRVAPGVSIKTRIGF